MCGSSARAWYGSGGSFQSIGPLRARHERRSVFLEKPIEILLGLVLRATVALLELAEQDLRVALDLIDVVVSELPPLAAYAALQLVPLSLERIRVHAFS